MADINILNNSGGVSSSELTATSSNVLNGYTYEGADTNDDVGVGTIPIKSAQTYNASKTNQTITANQYLGGTQTIRQLTTNLGTGTTTNPNVRKGAVITIKSGQNTHCLVTGTYTNTAKPITSNVVLPGYAGFANGALNQINGSMTTTGAINITPKSTDQSIPSGRCITGNIIVKGDANLVSSNIIGGKSIFGVSGATGTSALNVYSSYSSKPNGYWITTSGSDVIYPQGSPFYNKKVCNLMLDMGLVPSAPTWLYDGPILSINRPLHRADQQKYADIKISNINEIATLLESGTYSFRARALGAYLIGQRITNGTYFHGNTAFVISFPAVDFEVAPYRGFNVTYTLENAYTAKPILLLVNKNQLNELIKFMFAANSTDYKYTGAYTPPRLFSGSNSFYTCMTQITTGYSGQDLNYTWQPGNWPSSGKYFILIAFSTTANNIEGVNNNTPNNVYVTSLKPILR